MVIQGREATLVRHKPVILIELLRKRAREFGYHTSEVVELLGRHGYQAYTISNKGLPPCSGTDEKTWETNLIFLHEQKHDEPLELI